MSASIGYAGGRKDSISFSGEGSDDLKGMGNVPGSVIALVAGRRARQRGRRIAGDDRRPDPHTSRGFAGHVDLAVPLLHAGINFRF
ncbi:hypothetical protein J2785_002724 [Burkholderia ambifaria]|nr:hypothetical protein [Burkholderia ambifaria]MDR6499568.1 hypothetical protein [Burkholderia ambifaria]